MFDFVIVKKVSGVKREDGGSDEQRNITLVVV